MILLAVIDTETGKEGFTSIAGNMLGIKAVSKRYFSDIKNLLGILPILSSNQEGFVAAYKNGLRVKFKGEEYKRLHKLISNLSTISIWENVANNPEGIKDFVDTMPDEYLPWITKTILDLWNDRNKLFEKASTAYKKVRDYPDRKAQAIEVMKNHKDLSGLIFIMLDDKPPGEMLWKMCKPSFGLPQILKDKKKQTK